MKGYTSLLVIALMLTLSACQRSADSDAPIDSEAAVQQAVAEPQPFQIVASSGTVYEGQRSLRLHFNAALHTSQDFDQLVLVEQDGTPIAGSWMLHEDGDQLVFPFVEAEQSYQLQVSGELRAADGTELGAAQSLSIATHALEPSVSFASRGSVLPARRGQGLPIVSLNVAEVDVEFFRVDPLQLPRFINRFHSTGRDDWWTLRRVPEWATSVYANRFSTAAEANQRQVSHLPVQNIAELQEPGLYLAVMKRAGHFDDQFQTSHFFVSDIGLHVRLHADSAEVLVASLDSGKPIANVELELIDLRGLRVAATRSSAEGQARLDLRPDRETVLLARHGKDLSLLAFSQPALDLAEFPVGGPQRRPLELFAWSGRDLYRPGETLRSYALLRDSDGRSVPAQSVFVNLVQPDGRVFERQRLQPDQAGYLAWERSLPEDVPLGRWTLEYRLDPEAAAVETQPLRVEAFLPERLKLELSSPQPTLDAQQRQLELLVDAQYLYGAPAAGNRTSASLSVRHQPHPLDSLPGWHFGDASTEPLLVPELFDTQLDNNGRLQTVLELPEETPSGTPLRVAVEVSVFESGGRAINRRLERTLFPAEAMLAVRPLFEDARADARGQAGFEVIRVDSSGRRLAAEQLQVRLLREHRQFHWSHDPQGGWRQDYTARIDTVDTRTLRLREDQPARLDFPVQWGEYRLQIDDPETGLRLVYPFVAGWSWGDGNRGLDARPDRVKLALDKERYSNGDTLVVTITPPHAGHGWLLLEGDRLLYSRRIEAKPGSKVELSLDPAWDRHDLYLSVVVLRPGSEPDTQTPSRALGVVHVPMDRRDRRIALQINTASDAVPGQRISVEIQHEMGGELPAWVTLSAVDQGIINITGYPVPDANRRFFGQRRHTVDGVDLYGRIIEYQDGLRARLRYGGDAPLQGLPQARRPTAEVQTVDLFHGPVRFNAEGKALIELQLPDFNGSLRLAALAYGEQQYGEASTQVQVRAPVLVEVSTPRVLAPGDRSVLSVDLGNFTGSDAEFSVAVSSSGPLRFFGSRQGVNLAENARRTLNFDFEALAEHGLAAFTVQVSGGGHQLERHFSIPVRAPWIAQRDSHLQILQPGQTLALEPVDARDWLPGSALTRLSLSTRPPLPMASSAEALIKYPYGCLEQTTSRALPLIWLDAERLQQLGIAGALPEDSRQAQLADALARISGLQLSSGHFSLWSGANQPAPMLTPYVAEFLLSARQAGLAVPEDVLQSALQRLAEDLQAGGQRFWGQQHAEHLHLAHAAWSGYVLARVQRAPLAALRRLHDQQRGNALSPLALTHLGLALAMQGDHARAEVALNEAKAFSAERPRWLGDYGSPLRDQALMLALLIEHGRDISDHQQMLLQVARDSASQRWLSTQEHGALLRLGLALGAEDGNPLVARLQQGDTRSDISQGRSWSRHFDAAELAQGISLEALGTRIYALSERVGLPAQQPAADDARLRLTRRWYTPDGKRWEGNSLREGDALIAHLEVETGEFLDDLLVVDPLPGGLELEHPDLGGLSLLADIEIDGMSLAVPHYYASIKHQEFHDDRYVAVVQTYSYSSAHLFYVVRAVSPGVFLIPAPWAEEMYRTEFRGSGAPGGTLTVTPP